MKISRDGSQAEIETLGAYLSSLVLDGREILLKSEDGRQTHGGACNLIPYAGRIRNGEYYSGGRRYSFPKEKEGNSIHGFSRNREFTTAGTSAGYACLKAVLSDRGYPSTLDLSVDYRLERKSISVSYTAQNTGAADAPLVIGSHPYFITEGRWKILPSVPARELHLSDGYFPDGSFRQFDFDRYLDEVPLDNCFEGGGDLRLSSGRGDIVIRRRRMDYFLVYNGAYARGSSVAIEPMTGAPDAFNNGIGLNVLAPGQKFECEYSITLPQ